MKLKIWGVRGAIPAPGPDTNRYGGNTSCISIVDSSGHLCIVDMGTGLVGLGNALLRQEMSVDADFSKGEGKATILLSHGHWDHIQGFPFFAPVFIPGNEFRVYGNATTSSRVEAILEGQMNPQFSPIYTLKNLGAKIRFEALANDTCFSVSNLEVCATKLPHGETTSLAFGVSEAGRRIVYASDVGYPSEGPSDSIVEFYRGADLLIHDATYTPEEADKHRVRGLSSYIDAARVAAKAGVAKLALFHYDQDHTDDQVDEHVRLCGVELERLGAGGIKVVGACEGQEFEF